ncbi:hybrid sensor histidine kinase/response regulator transcription factor [Pedobacter duraquae]|uniref:histidine kinase n=1 Tax=Pedobacter duraquae TaxID=425511 RepID=A0A4R6IKX9_9SPHI|nr:hybrid sensor histidine kinase/response regulator transcription factor [Pedobacter duraquae]TDO22717.1 two component regulator with propeller domain [Pedobacter duraquae]
MIRLVKLILPCLLLLLATIAKGQNLKFKHITVEDGLSNSTIECIFQDHRGFIWFGTRDGLNRYDGNQITAFKNTGKAGSISDNFIRCMLEDKDHNLWVGTSNGLNKFDPQQNKFTQYNNTNQGNNIITTIAENKQGIWVGTYGGGIALINQNKATFTQFHFQNKTQKGTKKDFINDVFVESDGNIWIASDSGIELLDVAKASAETKLDGFRIRVIEKAKDGSFWFATEENGLIQFNAGNNTFKTYLHQEKNNNSIGSNLVRAIAFDQQGKIWVGGINGGLNHFDPVTNRFNHYQNEAGNAASLSQRTVSALFVDIQGNLWVGTHRGGVNLYSPQAEKFNLFRQEPNKNSLSYNDVRAFHEADNGDIYIGTDGGGLDIYNKKSGVFTHHKFNPFNPGSVGADAILDISKTSSGVLLVGTWAGGLNRMHNDGTFTRYLHNADDPNSISSDYVQKSFEDSEHNIWIGTYYGGLNRFDQEKERFERIVQGSAGSRLIGNNIVAINEDHAKNLWIGTDDGGLNRYDLKTKVFSHYFTEGGKKPDLRVIFVDREGNLWVGQAGLYRFNPKTNKFSIFSQNAGLGTDFIKGITEDEHGNLWISTAKGLTKFNPKNHAFKKYNAADGLQGFEFESNAYLKTKSGEMFFGGINGFNSFYPKDIRTNSFIPPVYITEFQIFNKVISPQTDSDVLSNDISYTKNLDLDYDQATISFRFAALNYVSSENNNYAYKLEGEDKEWINIGNNRQAIYTNLDPGDYTFKVRATNNDGTWNQVGSAIKLHITPPFWASWWFRLLAFAAAVYLTYLALSFKRRLELRKIEEEKREEIHQTQLQFFTNISHEFRTPLSLILGPIERLLHEDTQESFQHYYNTIHRNANRLLRLINELMDFRKTASGALKLNVTDGNLSLFIDEIAEEFSEMAAEKNITFQVEKDKLPAEVWFDRQVIEKIILNLINNSLKYTKSGGQLKLQVLKSIENLPPLFANSLQVDHPYKSLSYVYFRVIDSGIGISKDSIQHLFERYYRITESHLGSGVGLAFVKSLTELHKGIIKVSSERNQGTEIIIGIPVLKTDYTPAEQFVQSATAGGTRLESITYQSEVTAKPTPFAPITESQSTQTILIVDDNDELRAFIKETLEIQYRILEAVDGLSGIEMASQHLPDLIISDVMMPGMNGIEFCKMIKESVETSHIPFMMLTAKNSIEAEIEGAESGADLYFTKPIVTSLLLLTLKNIFEQRQKIKEHYLKNKEIQPRELVHSEKDKLFMNQLISIIDAQMVNPELDIDYLCREIGMSRTKLYQKIKSITGQSIGEFVRSARLRKAVEIMKNEDVLMTEVMYRIGIQTQSYFTKAFKKEFGVTPTAYLQGLTKND